MGSYLNMIIAPAKVVGYISDLLEKYGISIYVELRDEKLAASYKALSVNEVLNNDYSCFFLSAIEVPLNSKTSFYDDHLFHYCIEAEGGHETAEDIELLKLRIISKQPDKKVRSFFTALGNRLKKDEAFGRGIYAGKFFYKDIFYDRSIAASKAMWFDFKRKEYQMRLEE